MCRPGYVLVVAGMSLLAAGAGGQTYLGNYTGYRIEGRAVTVHADTSAVRFIFYAPDIVRVDFLPSPATLFDSSFVVVRDTTQAVPPTITDSDSQLTIESPALRVGVRKFPVRISYQNAAGQLLAAEPAPGGLASQHPYRYATFALNPDEHFYGTGERGAALDLNGQAFDSYNTQVYGYSAAPATMSVNIPFLTSSHGYAVYFEDSWGGRFDLGVTDPSHWWYRASGGELLYFFIAAPTVAAQLERYTWLTGRQPLPPRWTLGYIQSKFGYAGEAEARAAVQTMRQKRIPCDGIILDLYWYDHMGDLAWDLSHWPDPPQMVSDFLSDGIKTTLITQTYLTAPSLNFGEAAAGGHVGTGISGEPYILPNWWSCGCDAYLVDLTRPATRDWFWGKHPSFLGSNVAGVWTDLAEPERHPLGMLHYLGPAGKVHNIYSLLWAQTIHDGFAAFRPGRRFFNLTRSGYAGIQRYGVATWSGDVSRSFGGLAAQLPIMLNMGMSGIAYHNSDIGGFCCGTTTPELYARWMEYGTLCPIARAHGTGQPTEPWGFGPAVEAIAKNFIELRYRLLPYLYTAAHENSQTGMPIVRPLFFEDPSDPQCAVDFSSYLLGANILVSPVVAAGQTTKDVYLPAGTWIDFWSDAAQPGGLTLTVPAPLERIPLFVKAGSIIPMQPIMQFSDERPLDTLMLAVYPSQERSASFTLYEDDGTTRDYVSGAFALTEFTAALTGETAVITLFPRAGAYAGMPVARVYLSEVHGIAQPPAAVMKNGVPVPLRSSLDDLRSHGDGYFYDPAVSRLFIHTPALPESLSVLTVEGLVLAAAQPDPLPRGYALEAAYPNPFNTETTLRFTVPVSSPVTVTVFNILGQAVTTLFSGQAAAGSHTVRWAAGALPSGAYFCRMDARQFNATQKLMLLK